MGNSQSPLVTEVIDDAESFGKVGKRAALKPKGSTGLVLISTGAYAPVHKMHIQILEEAKARLEESGHFVLGGFLSPSHDNYVSRKMKKANSFHIPHQHRVAMCELAASKSDWISTSAWEAKRSKFSYINETVEYICLRIHQLFPELSFEVVYVAGIDTISKCDMYWGLNHHYGTAAVIGVGRAGYNSREAQMRIESKDQKLPIFDFVEKEMEDHSSTKARQELKKGNDVTDMCGEEVSNYFRANGLYELVNQEISDVDSNY